MRSEDRGRRGWIAALLALSLLIVTGGGFLAAEHAAFPLAGQATGTSTPHHVAARTRPSVHHGATPKPGTSGLARPRATVRPQPTLQPTAPPATVPPRVAIPLATSAPTATPTPQPTSPPATTPPAGPPGVSLAANTGTGTPVQAIQSFYALVGQHQFQQAAQLWTASMRETWNPAIAIDRRFRSTRQISLVSASTVSETATSATIHVDVLEVSGSPPTTTQYVGTWSLVKVAGQWLLSSPDLRPA